ncbi:MAG TPA: beta-galactosidase GalB [bacterium]|nr:beta-galactosidase GalB [bacterium]
MLPPLRDVLWLILAVLFAVIAAPPQAAADAAGKTRQRISLNAGWKFFKYDQAGPADSLIYDVRPPVRNYADGQPADTRPGAAEELHAAGQVLKPWVLPTGNEFLPDSTRHFIRPPGDPGSRFPFVQKEFDDRAWEEVNLPHDWAIAGPFVQGDDNEIGGGMGRLPSPGVAWYRKKLAIPASDAGCSIFLDVDGAMSYAMVWVNGHLAGGWPYGYTSWRLDLTPWLVPGAINQLAIRLDNPPASSRWYPGGGLYRNVWLTTTRSVHIAYCGTFLTARAVSPAAATLDLQTTLENDAREEVSVRAVTRIYARNRRGTIAGKAVASFPPVTARIAASGRLRLDTSLVLRHPRLWGPPPQQAPNLYIAVTSVEQEGRTVDRYETPFGIRAVRFDPDSGLFVNDQPVRIQGVNQHHDLGALGAAFHTRAAERQLEILREMGCNAIRMSHNPPAPELLELTDRMGFLVLDEAFDTWELKKNPLDFHLIFADWHEQDLRAMVRRDRNHPSVILWSIGNEVGEQYTGAQGAALARRLRKMVREEDPTRPVTCAMNWAKPDMPLPAELDLIGVNYQGEGIRQAPEFAGTDRIRTAPQYPAFHQAFPEKVVLSTETASTLSSRGVYLFPVSSELSAPVRDGRGGDPGSRQVSAYELYAVDFGASVDKVFGSLDRHPFVAGEFVWTGWDYLGEPTPYYESRSSYSGIIDLAGFRKDRFYLYQSRWQPQLPMVHILPHWSWPERLGQITPVHIFTSGDEVELFLNGRSLGRKHLGPNEYRLRWDEVTYTPGELKAVAYKNGKEVATERVRTTGAAARLEAQADRTRIAADGEDLAFVTVRVTDAAGLTVPRAGNLVRFTVTGPGEIAATDNGDPTDMVPFPAAERTAFSGLVLAIVRSRAGASGTIVLQASSPGLKTTQVVITSAAKN